MYKLILWLAAFSVSAVYPSPGLTKAQIEIQHEAHKLVEQLNRKHPGIPFTFVLTNQPEIAERVSENLSAIELKEELQKTVQQSREMIHFLGEENKVLTEKRAELEEQKQTVLQSIRQMYSELAVLEAQRDQFKETLDEMTKSTQILNQEREQIRAELTHLREVSLRLNEALMEVPDIRLSKTRKEY